jgi:hypothetical protein
MNILKKDTINAVDFTWYVSILFFFTQIKSLIFNDIYLNHMETEKIMMYWLKK